MNGNYLIKTTLKDKWNRSLSGLHLHKMRGCWRCGCLETYGLDLLQVRRYRQTGKGFCIQKVHAGVFGQTC